MILIKQFNTTNQFHTNKSLKSLNQLVNHNMKQLNNWLSANKISLNAGKPEQVNQVKLVISKERTI